MDTTFVIIRNAVDLAQFHQSHPNGYTIMDGDRGIGLIGRNADFARNCGNDPNGWIAFAEFIGPAIHEAHDGN